MATSTTSCLICHSDPQSNYICNLCKRRFQLDKIKMSDTQQILDIIIANDKCDGKLDFYNSLIKNKCRNQHWDEKGPIICGKEVDKTDFRNAFCKDCIHEMDTKINENPNRPNDS